MEAWRFVGECGEVEREVPGRGRSGGRLDLEMEGVPIHISSIIPVGTSRLLILNWVAVMR